MLRTLALAALLIVTALPASAGLKEGVAAYRRGDYGTAYREFKAFAERGHAKAQFALGVMYDKGQGVQKNPREAAVWYRKAAEQGNAGAQLNLGVMYDKGRGVPHDYVLAYMWFALAADRGDKLAAKARDLVVKLMTPSQVARARGLAAKWKPSKARQAK